MNNCPVFHKSLLSSTASKVNVGFWDDSLSAFDDKQYLKSFHLLMDYVNAELRPKYGNADGTVFKIPHGSIIVNIAIENNEFKVSAPFLEVNESSIVPLLRQVCSLNFNNMDLAQIYLRDNRLDFEYSCKLSQVNPYKIYYLLKEICITGDKYDDEYVTKFGAKRVYEPIITPYEPAKAETAYSTILQIVKDGIEYINYFESKRWYSLGWDMAAVALRQVEYYGHPQGQVRNDLEDAISDMYNKSLALPEKVSNAKDFLQSLLDMEKSKFVEDLYETEVFISTKRRSTLQNIQENLAEAHKRTKEGMANGSYMGVTMDILFSFYNMYYYNDLQEDVSQLVVDALEKSSGKPWEQAAFPLSSALNKIMDGDVSTGKKGGFFSRLFGK